MPVDKGGERGEQRSPDDWSRIESERAERDALSRKYDELHDPSPEFEQAARPLPPDYGSHRPKHLDLTEAQKDELEATYGRPIEELLALRERDPRNIHYRTEPDTGRRPDAEQRFGVQLAAGTETRQSEDGSADPANSDYRAVLGEVAEGLRSGRLTAEQAADRLDSYHADPVNDSSQDDIPSGSTDDAITGTAHDQTGDCKTTTETNAWDNVEGEKPDRESIHVTDARRVHILDGNGEGDGGHMAGTGLPLKTEFPETWNDEKIINEVEDVARHPDHPPELTERGRWETVGTRDGVEIRVVLNRDGMIVTGFPERGAGVIKNDRYGNPQVQRS